MARATEWKESVLSDMRAGEASDIVVRSIADLKTEKKRLVDIVYGIFDGRDVVDYFDSLGFFDCVKGRTEAHYDSIIRQGGLDG